MLSRSAILVNPLAGVAVVTWSSGFLARAGILVDLLGRKAILPHLLRVVIPLAPAVVVNDGSQALRPLGILGSAGSPDFVRRVEAESLPRLGPGVRQVGDVADEDLYSVRAMK